MAPSLHRALRRAAFTGALIAVCGICVPMVATASTCTPERPDPMIPATVEQKALCEELTPKVKDPSGYAVTEYEGYLSEFFNNFCHRDTDAGWERDKFIRNAGPFAQMLTATGWVGQGYGTHAPVVIWYSPEAAVWIKANRGEDDEGFGPDGSPMPDGAMLVKEMFSPAPASLCEGVDPLNLYPTSGAAIMVRDAEASHDGYFWGWYGWPGSGWTPNFPANNQANSLPDMGFGQYCMNCHASARDNSTFSSARNMEGQPGLPLVFLDQTAGMGTDDAITASTNHHANVVLPQNTLRLGTPLFGYSDAFLDAFPTMEVDAVPNWNTVSKMPSQTYDTVFMPAGEPTAHAQFMTSDQCVGCHDAGGTGLSFAMTSFNDEYGKLNNLSPYATWGASPMGLAGRDPIFYAQLASETQTFHPDKSELIQNTCLGCHGIMGQRQYEIDQHAAGNDCPDYLREFVNAVPFPPDNEHAGLARYAALSRDGISCASCHHMVLGTDASGENADQPWNACIDERQEFLNPGASGFATTFTGSFLVGPPDELYGPYEDPKEVPMENTLGIEPVFSHTISQSEVCGTCHTVHLPVLWEGEIVAHVYEQTTYPEWAFSDFRTGENLYSEPNANLPFGAGDQALSCQECHMTDNNPAGTEVKSKIAGIQEYSTFPQAEFTTDPENIDLPVRPDFSEHALVGLNVFLIKMAQQFPDVMGIRTTDPMLVSKGVPPLIRSEQQMLNQAANFVADVSVTEPSVADGSLTAMVSIKNKVGHKFPSGVGFRRAFLEFEVLDQNKNVLWVSGKTDAIGRILGADGMPLPGELWWEPDCSARINPEERIHQPHYQTITSADQVQIYQELVSTPPPGVKSPQCGHDVEPAGHLTTSFLSICAEVKDNRLLPSGYLPLEDRILIAEALGAGPDLAMDAGSTAVGDDPDYVTGGGDSLEYVIPMDQISGVPDAVRATLYYQSIPPFYLQDRFCTAQGPDTDRLYFMTGNLNLEGTEAANWALKVQTSGEVKLQ